MADLKFNREKLLDKLCERWLFEKNIVGLYDRVLDKLERHGHRDEARQLRRFREQEFEHQNLLEAYIERSGGHTSTATPSQIPVRLASRAYETIAAEARSPAQLLHVILSAELEDNVGWELLIGLATEAGAREFIDAFDTALRQENEHLEVIKSLVAEHTRRELIEPRAAEPLIPLI